MPSDYGQQQWPTNAQQSWNYGPPARRRSYRRWWLLPVGLAVLGCVTAVSIWAATPGLTQAELTYFDAIHHPCQHLGEIFELVECQGFDAAFIWEGDEDAQILEGHEICVIKVKVGPPSSAAEYFASNPILTGTMGKDAAYEAPRTYLESRHPSYSEPQINTQIIAAEHTLC